MGRRPALWLLCVLLAACGAGTTAGLDVQRYDVGLNVLSDGSMSVIETVAVRWDGPGSARFGRVLRPTHADSIFDVDARLDGDPIAKSGGRADVDRRGVLRVVAPVAPGVHTVRLRYRIAGALSFNDPSGDLNWPLFEPDRRYGIAAARVTLSLPSGVAPASPASISGRDVALASSVEGMAAELGAVGPSDSIAMQAQFLLSAVHMSEPAWQNNQARARDLMPAFVAAGLCLLVVGAGIVVMIWLQYPAFRPGDAPAPGDPASLPPAMVVAVARKRLRTNGASRLGALIHLSERRHLDVSEAGVTWRASEADANLTAHEQAILHELWLQQSSRGPIPMREALRGLAKRAGKIDRELRRDLVQAGLVDAERLSVSKGLRVSALTAVVVSIACAVAVDVWLRKFGVWPQAVSIGVAGMAVVFALAAPFVPCLSARGASAQQSWAATLSSLKSPEAGDGRWFALAVASGFGRAWLTRHPLYRAESDRGQTQV